MKIAECRCVNDVDPVVVVDDSPVDLMITKRVYTRSELKNPLVTLSSGEVFLQYMEVVQAGKSSVPAMVLMDINMPSMDGFETLVKLRQCPDFSRVPIVVMLTNSNSNSDVEKSVTCGANGFQTKDFNFDRYMAFFNSLKANSNS